MKKKLEAWDTKCICAAKKFKSNNLRQLKEGANTNKCQSTKKNCLKFCLVPKVCIFCTYIKFTARMYQFCLLMVREFLFSCKLIFNNELSI